MNNEPWKNDYSIFKKIWFLLFAATLVVIIAYGLSKKNPEKVVVEVKTENQLQMESLEFVARNVIINTLKSPSTANFPSGSISSYHNGTNWVVSGAVDAQNSFGSYLRQSWVLGLVAIPSCSDYRSVHCWEIAVGPVFDG